MSTVFSIGSGVRQGGSLSPALFNSFINVIISNLQKSGFGCHVQQTYVGCILYADDIILLSPALSGLQSMINVCYATSCDLLLEFNAKKSHCIAFSKTTVCMNQSMQLGPDVLMWTQTIKYLGVHLLAGRSIGFDMSPTKRPFYGACNSILNHANNLDETVQLGLQESYTLPILTYSIAALDLKAKQLAELNVCWNSVYRRLFGFHK